MILSAPVPEFADFVPATRDGLELSARYCVETKDGQIEVWSGHLLYARMRPEFVHGRAVQMAKIERAA